MPWFDIFNFKQPQDAFLDRFYELFLFFQSIYVQITDNFDLAGSYPFKHTFHRELLDYNKDAKTTKVFFAKVQNKLHYGVHEHTAAELVFKRADSKKDYMGLTSWKNAPDGKIIKTDVSIAKNYLAKNELESLGRIVNAYLDLAEERAKRQIPMTMQDWVKRLDLFLEYDDRAVLQNAGKITAQIAKDHAETEFEKYRITQDRLFQSDFDKEIKKLLKNDDKNT